MLRASKTYKGWSPQGSWPSPFEGVAEVLRGALLLREWPHRPFSPTGPLQSVCMCIGILKPQQQILRAEICVTHCLGKKKLLLLPNNYSSAQVYRTLKVLWFLMQKNKKLFSSNKSIPKQDQHSVVSWLVHLGTKTSSLKKIQCLLILG